MVPSRRFSFCHGRQNQNGHGTPVVPRRIEFENYRICINRSFQTHRFGFDKDVKTKPSCRNHFL
ncbi:hypothetical protein DWQ65_10900 [Treponema phagedenis]|nr:hypothetical protein FUT84_01560 [Treponema phagedenis]QEK04926.1 hypothetical protein FUT83_14745 [Treponema phagedenis]QSI00555.1 hypothetical protein DWQ65_10900 [Treponema phagedenis]